MSDFFVFAVFPLRFRKFGLLFQLLASEQKVLSLRQPDRSIDLLPRLRQRLYLVNGLLQKLKLLFLLILNNPLILL
jgi:hypothetical protein